MENANNFELFTDMTMDDVREYEKNMHEKTNIKVCNQHSSTVDEIESHAKARVCQFLKHIAHPQLIYAQRSENSSQLILLISGILGRFCLSKNSILLPGVQSYLSFAL